jgi:hypothetical protein
VVAGWEGLMIRDHSDRGEAWSDGGQSLKAEKICQVDKSTCTASGNDEAKLVENKSLTLRHSVSENSFSPVPSAFSDYRFW